MPKRTDVYVFAYGSNLHLGRMRSRVPSADIVSIGYVAGRRFHFHKRSVDGSAKADAFRTGIQDHRVWGVVYRIDSAEKPVLDEYEYLGIGYDEERVDVVVDGASPIVAWIYTARSAAIDQSLRPYSWYMNFVLHGAFQHRLPFCYIAQLSEVQSRPDPDLSRHDKNGQFIGQSPRHAQ